MAEYNGWTNYETWAVNLWITNEESENARWIASAAAALESEEGDEDDAAVDLAAELREAIEETVPELEGMFADLLAAAIGEVNWREIAASFVAAAKEEA